MRPAAASTPLRRPLRRRRLLPARRWPALVAALLWPVVAGSASVPDLPQAFVDRVAVLVNEYRAQHRLGELSAAETLGRVAEGHSRRMAEVGRPSHDGFRDRFRAVDSELCVENIAAYFESPEALVDGWRRSPAHDRNLLEPRIGRMGLAARGRYVTFFACR